LILRRFCSCSMGTFGELTTDSGFSCFTVEKPWKNNAPWISCIPPGQYEVRPRRYNRGGYAALEVLDVPNRTDILIHKGNTAEDVQGCIVPGMRLGCLGDRWAVLSSSAAFAVIMGEPQTSLLIRWSDTSSPTR